MEEAVKQDLEKRRKRYRERKARIKAQPAIKSWTEVSPHAGWAGYLILFFIWAAITVPASMTEMYSFWHIGPFMALVIGIAGGSIFLIGTKYHYHITEEGFYADYQRDFPEWSLKIVRGIGVFGVVVCCVLAFFYGPALFIGAGASALGAFALVNYKEPVDSDGGIWQQVEYAFVFKKRRVLGLKGDKGGELSYTEFELYFEGSRFDDEVEEILALLPKDIQVIQVNHYNDMFIVPDKSESESMDAS